MTEPEREECRAKILSNDYYDIIRDFTAPPSETEGGATDYCIEVITRDYGIVHVAREGLPVLNYANYSYTLMPVLYTPILDTTNDSTEFGMVDTIEYERSLEASGILTMQNPPLSLTGRGVLIGYIDTGIDYRNDAFRYSNGNTRIAAIWDQSIQTGTVPDGFLYGSEYTEEMINRALESDNPFSIVPSRDEIGHGTAIAGTNAAPDAAIAMVKLKPAKEYLREFYRIREDATAYQETDLLMAVKYLDALATRLNMPMVICIGLGTNMGDHAGTSVSSFYMNQISDKEGRVIVIAGGHEGNAGHHYYGELKSSPENVEIRVGENESGLMLELWGRNPDILSVSVKSPGGEIIPRVLPQKRFSGEYGFVFERTRVNIDYILTERSAGDELIMIRFLNPTPGIWTIGVYGDANLYTGDNVYIFGTYHIWLPISGFTSEDTFFLLPNPDVTLTEPAYTGKAISLSTYQADNDSFYIDSGRGYSREDQIVPDLSAPGVNVLTAGIGQRIRVTGSSMAAGITSGAVAQFLEWAVTQGNMPRIRAQDIKYFMIRGAIRDNRLTYPNRQWGYGRMNIKGAFDAMRGI